jgi:hypothetical protein
MKLYIAVDFRVLSTFLLLLAKQVEIKMRLSPEVTQKVKTLFAVG